MIFHNFYKSFLFILTFVFIYNAILFGQEIQDIVNGNLIQFSRDGAWCWYQDERAVVDIANNKIIIASNRLSDGHDYVDIYDISTGTNQNYDLGFIGSDDHNTPALLIRPDGKYLAMFSKHNTDKITHYRIFSNGSWSTDQTFDWNTQPGGSDFNTTYSNVYYLSAEDHTYNLSRGNGHGGQNFIISSDQGNTWTYGGFLTTNVEIGYVSGYFKYCSNGIDRIDFVCTEYHPRDFNTSIYHGYIKNGQTFKSDSTLVDNNIFNKNPTSPQDYTLVFLSNTVLNGLTMTNCWNIDVQRYSDGTIATIVTARTNTDSYNPTHAFIYCRYNQSTWSSTYLGNAGLKLTVYEQDYTGLAAMHPNTPDIIYISSTYDPRDNTFLTKHEIFKGVTRDGGKTWSWTPITENSTMDNLRPIVPVWENYKTALMWFRGTFTGPNTQIVGIITDETSTVPVELTSFSAMQTDSIIILQWGTATETNNHGFEIERQVNKDGAYNSWNVIGFKEGHGTTTKPSKYTFFDNYFDNSATSISYRLKQVDYNGSFEYSNIVEIKNIAPLKFNLAQNYPNPFNPNTKIRYQLPQKSKVIIKLYDILGAEVKTLLNEEKELGIYEIKFTAESIPSGTYIYRMTAGDYIETKKMVLMK